MHTDQNVPWIVFAESASIHEQPDVAAPVRGTIPRDTAVTGGDLVFGESSIEWLPIESDGEAGYLLRCHIMRIHPDNQSAGDIPIGKEFVNRWWGLPLDYEPSDLVSTPPEWGHEAGRVYRLRRAAADAMVEMLRAAAEDDIHIRICSDYRSGRRQLELFQRAVEKDGPEQRYSAPPGHSEHQLGTTVDLVDAEGRHLFSQEMDQFPEGKWLEDNAHRFGFRRSYYPHNVKETGYISEPWHWRFMGR